MIPLRSRIPRSSNNGEMPFLDHLEELRWRIVYAVAALLGGAAIGIVIVLNFDVLALLTRPIQPYLAAQGGLLAVTDAVSALSIYMQLVVTLAMVLALPVILYQLWAFLSPALHRHERRMALLVIAASTALFVVGAALAYFYAIPQTFAMSARLQRNSLMSFYIAEDYFKLVTSMVIGFGLAFEIPIVLVGMRWVGILSHAALSGSRRYAAIGVFIMASVLTPGDAINNNIILSIPLYLLFEASVVVSWLIERRRNGRHGAPPAPAVLIVLAYLLHSARGSRYSQAKPATI